MEIIQKHIDIANLAFKAENDNMTIEGYASTFGNIDQVGDIIEAGCFGKKLNPRKVKFLNQHNMREPIGVIEEIYEDDKGLFIKARFSNTSLGRDVYTLAKDGAIDAFSIGFSVEKSSWGDNGTRKISKAKLWEVSAVTFPANEEAKVTAVKSLGESGFKSKRDFEEVLKYIGFSQKEALIITAKAYPTLVEHWDNANNNGVQGEPADYSEIKSELNNLLNKLKGI